MGTVVKPCPECKKRGRTVAMRVGKRARPTHGAAFMAEDIWFCASCGHIEEVED